MMSIWSHRPSFLHLGLFFVAYVLGCGFAQSLAIVPGTGISIWPPAGLFIATLVLAPRPSWPWWVLAGCLAELFSNFLWFHSPLPAAFLIYIGNALAAAAGAWLINRACRQPVHLETLREVLAFVVLGAGIAPIFSATVGSATLAWFGILSQTFAGAWPLWWIGDATGVLIVAPLALVVFQNWRSESPLSPARWIEACILGLIFLAVAALSLSGYLPFAYIIMPPLLWAAVRFEFKGAAVTLVLLALITAVFTISGASQFAGDPESQRHNQIMLHLFLAISAFSALVVAAISRQHHMAMLTLQQSERSLREQEGELSQLVDMVPSHVWRLTPEGEPTFFNKRMVDFIGFDVSDRDKPGVSRIEAMIEASIHPDDAAEFKDALGHSLVTGESFVMRYRLRHTNGIYRWMSSRAEPMRDQAGRIVQWYGLCHDIDDQMHAEEALRQSERRLQQLTDAVPALIWAATPEGVPSYVNKRFKDVTGATLEDIAAADGSLLLSVIHPDDRGAARQAVSHSFKTGVPYVQRYRQHRSDGSYRWTETRAEPLRDESGAIFEWYGVSVDIDDEVRAQEALRGRERELSLLVDMVPSNLWRLTPEGETTLANKHMADFLGMDLSDKRQMETVFDTIFHPDDAQPVADALVHCLQTGNSFAMKYRLRRRDGAYRWMSGRAEPLRNQDGNIVQWFGLCHDIDDEVRAQEALRERERELSLLVDMVPSNLWRLSPDSEITLVNKRMAEFLGMNVNDKRRPEMVIDTLIHPDDAEAVGDTLGHSLLTGDSFSMSFRLRRWDGVYRWMSARAEPMRDEDGKIVQWFGLYHDVDDQTRAEDALRKSERRLQQMIDAVPIRIWSMTPKGGPIYFNKRYQDYLRSVITNFDTLAEPRVEQFVQELIHPDDASGVLGTLQNCFETGVGSVMRFRWREKNGVYRWAECRVEPRRDEDGAIAQWYGVSIDIDDEVRAQEALRRAFEKLAQATQAASLAELSASIAHEVNQPLAAIVANSHACHRWLSAEPPNLERAMITAERITRDANAAADVVNRIRALFRRTPHARSHEDVNRLITEVCRLMADEISAKRSRISMNLMPDLPLVALDRIQVQQVFVNLIRNGIESMDAAVDGARVLQISSCRDGLDAIRVQVRDTGTGFKDAECLFEPFFTTKEHGMGMGLAICRSIVESHGGRLWAEKNKPQGAALIFTLPTEMKTAS